MALACLGAALLLAEPAWSACVPGGSTVPGGSAVNCTGADTTGVGDGTQDNVSVTVQSGASIAVGNNTTDINLHDNNVVTNNGTITGGDNTVAIQVRNGNTVTNSGSIVLGGGAAKGILTSTDSTITNTGSIFMQTGTAIQSSGLRNPIFNSGNLTFATGGRGLVANGGDDSPIVNSGAITMLNGGGTGIFTGGARNTVNNSGAITFINGGGVGIEADLMDSAITNSGAIRMDGDGFGIQTASAGSGVSNNAAITIGGTGAAIRTFGDNSGVNNSGAISVGGTNATGIQTAGVNSGVINSAAISVASGSGIVTAGDNSSIINSGAVTVAGTIANPYAVWANGVGSNIVNSGTVVATGNTIIGLFSFLGNVTNSGSVTAPIAVEATGTGVTVVNSGTIRGNLTVNGGSATVSNTGLIDGRVSIPGLGNDFTNSGIITVTSTSLALNVGHQVRGNFTQDPSGIIGLRVNSAGLRDNFFVDGTSHLGGTLGAVVQPGLYANSTTYTGAFIQIQNPLTSSFAQTLAFAAGTTTPLAFFTVTPTYQAASIDLTLNRIPFGSVPGETQNQRSVGNALESGYSTTLTGAAANFYSSLLQSTSLGALTQGTGESATASQQTTFDAMGQFMGVLTDPFVAGRGDPVSAGGDPAAYADESLGYAANGKRRSQNERDAYAMFTKAPLRKVYDPHWSVWAAGFGGSQTTDGNVAVGSNDTRSSIYGTAVGADYLLSPHTIAGFALAGGGTNFSVNNLGSGRSDLFQAGAFVRHSMGAAYLSGALAYGWQDVTTDRTITAAGIDHLRAEFHANAWSGRLEGGYRFVAPVAGGLGITPYAAGQFTTFDLPAYAEQVISGAANLALNYTSKSVTDTRSELGLRTDKSFAMANGVLTLRGRAAWAHDFDPDRSVAATFQALPGASFVVNGAAQASDSVLTTASVDMKWLNGWSASATFEGEFSDVTTSYAGKGVVRYQW